MDAKSGEANAEYVAAFLKLQYVNLGLYVWEYLTHLHHDWQLVRGAWPWRWPLTTWAYLTCRNSILLSTILSIITFGDLPCTSGVVYLSYLVPFPLVLSASYLLAVRTIAVWSRALWATAICAVSLLALLSIAVFSMVILCLDTVSQPSGTRYAYACVRLGSNHILGVKLSVIAIHVVNGVMFSLLFAGLRRHRTVRPVGLLRVVWKQSLALLALATILDIPILIMAWIRVNGVIFSMSLAMAALLLGLGATHMTRNLYQSGQSEPSPREFSDGSLRGTQELSTVEVWREEYSEFSRARFQEPQVLASQGDRAAQC
ncbi:unnamed protein product [Peniophora sp. CBMAI 1063]|nr:unnamed protein product [Peniophora sp. CBMAI 1063]